MSDSTAKKGMAGAMRAVGLMKKVILNDSGTSSVTMDVRGRVCKPRYKNGFGASL